MTSTRYKCKTGRREIRERETMTLATTVRIEAPVNPQLAFLKGRELIGIPGEHPFKVTTPGLGWTNGEWYASKPDGFRSALDVSHADGALLVPYADEEDGPACFVVVRFDTAYGYRDDVTGQECEGLHQELTKGLGEWLDTMGVPWSAQDEYSGVWYRGWGSGGFVGRDAGLDTCVGRMMGGCRD